MTSNVFVNLIHSQCVGPNDIFVSIDVASLFTSVAIDQALDLVLQLLTNDNILHERISLDLSDTKASIENMLLFTIKRSALYIDPPYLSLMFLFIDLTIQSQPKFTRNQLTLTITFPILRTTQNTKS